MEQLVRAALAHGMVPKVVAPYRHSTVGGAVRFFVRSLILWDESLTYHTSLLTTKSDHGLERVERVAPPRLLPRLV
jgi:hypothetical protein